MARLLRYYRRIADKQHYCNNCRGAIMPGEEYEGRVYITPFAEGNRVIVDKQHLNCPFDDPGRDEEDSDLSTADGLARDEEDMALPAAA
ncbi:MAG: hypothetical protein HY397_00625 [Candidatus Doudnabacteria bacterium]|nr:hypothetical protein [Candidatus Doudnabacteria bacterium]